MHICIEFSHDIASIYPHQNDIPSNIRATQNQAKKKIQNIKMLNALHEKFLKLCLRTALTNTNEVLDIIERRINSETTFYSHY